MQPPHTACTRPDGSDEWSRRLGAARAGHAWRLRELRDAGAILALGSDRPVAHHASARSWRRPAAPGARPPGDRV